jgi:hypothetical protein
VQQSVPADIVEKGVIAELGKCPASLLPPIDSAFLHLREQVGNSIPRVSILPWNQRVENEGVVGQGEKPIVRVMSELKIYYAQGAVFIAGKTKPVARASLSIVHLAPLPPPRSSRKPDREALHNLKWT